MLDLVLFTLAGREEHVAILAVHSTEGFLLVCILVGHIVWQETVEEHRGHNFNISSSSCPMHCIFSQQLCSYPSTPTEHNGPIKILVMLN